MDTNLKTNIKINWKYVSWALIWLAVIFKTYIIFWQFKEYNLLVPPSPDLVSHLKMIDNVLEGKFVFNYPPLFHWIIASFSWISGYEPLDVLKSIAPFWLLLAIYPFYLLSRSMFGWRTAFWSTMIFILVSANPLLNFGDAQYPDILAYNIIAPFYLLLLIQIIRTGKYWYFIPTFLLFLLMIPTHHLTSALMLVITVLSLIAYAIYAKINNRKDEIKKSLITLGLFVAASVPMYIASQIFFGKFFGRVINDLLLFQTKTGSVIYEVLEYSEISYILAPFLEFIGFAGLVWIIFKLPKFKKYAFPAILLLIWIITFWLMSRSSLFYLPQRILRELSFPLCIASGYFAVSMTKLFTKSWQKILFFGAFGYLIIINSVQIFQSPFLLPDGFKYMSWFTSVDQQKYDYITNNLMDNCTILTNQSNPILEYKLEKDGCKFININELYKDFKIDADYLPTYISKAKAKYIYIGVIPEYTSADVYYSQFGFYEEATELLKMYEYNKSDIVKEFSDGSIIINVDSGLPKPTDSVK